MKLKLALVLLFTLGACATAPQVPPEPAVVIKIERIVTPIPSALLDLPPSIPALPDEVVKSDDKAVAKWLLDSEERALALEAQVRQIRDLYIKNLRNARAANVKEGIDPEHAAAAASQAN